MAVGFVAAMSLATACGGSNDAGAVDGATPDATSDGGAMHVDGGQAESLRILFIGNSYTYFNDLPAMVRDALASAPGLASVEVESVTVGGATLADHWMAGTALVHIREGAFTHVVVQGQSLESCSGSVTPGFHDYALLFAEAIHDAGATVVFYETWARRAGDPFYDTVAGHPISTPAGMHACLSRQYETVAWTGMARLAPVGTAWYRALEARPELGLYMDDGSHPSLEGSWLAASVFVCTLTDRSARGLLAPPLRDTSDVGFLANTADEACALVASGSRDGTDGVASTGCLRGSAIHDEGCSDDAECVLWAGMERFGIREPARVEGATARCVYTERVDALRCRRADDCTGPHCTCGGGPECADDQMCASDGPGLPFRCVCMIPQPVGPT